MLVKTTPEWYHFLSIIKDLVTDYYDNFNLRVNSGTTTSECGERDYHRMNYLVKPFLPGHEHASQVG